MKSTLKLAGLLLVGASLMACGGGGSDSATKSTASVVDKYVGDWSNTLCSSFDDGYANVYVNYTKTSATTMTEDAQIDYFTNSSCSGVPEKVRITFNHTFTGTKATNGVTADKVETTGPNNYSNKELMYVQGKFLYTGDPSANDSSGYPLQLNYNATYER